MIGLERAVKEVYLAATFDDEGRQITPQRSLGYDHPGDRDRQRDQ